MRIVNNGHSEVLNDGAEFSAGVKYSRFTNDYTLVNRGLRVGYISCNGSPIVGPETTIYGVNPDDERSVPEIGSLFVGGEVLIPEDKAPEKLLSLGVLTCFEIS